MLQNSAPDNPSAYRSSFWGIRCEGGKKYSQVVKQKFHISMAALDASVVPASQCISLMVERGGCEYLLCNLKPDSLLQVNLNLYFDKGEKIAFFLKGHGTVHLSGYLIYGENKNLEDSGGIKGSEQNQVTISLTKDKKAKTGNVKTNEMCEAKESKKAETPTKKLFFSPEEKVDNFLIDDADMFDEDSEAKSNEEKVTSPKKSVAVLKEISKVTAKDKESSDEEEDESSEDDLTDIKALQRVAQKRPLATNEEEEDSDEDDDEDDDEEDDEEEEDESDSSTEVSKKKPFKDVQNKKLKVDTSTPIQAKKAQTPKKSAEVIDLEDDDSSKPGEMNSSIGRTPMPKKQATSIFEKKLLDESKKGKKPLEADESDSDSDSDDDEDEEEEMDTSTSKPSNKNMSNLNMSSETPSSKKKAKKLAASANESNLSVSGDTSFKANGDLSKAQYGKKLAGGIEYEDIRIGNGPIAKKGRLVHVYYTGKLENNKVFDSCQVGKKPFSFKLGSGQVIKGWDLGIEGMKVGGKRRLKIPPQMGYNKVRTGPIPPNSTLYFIVEVKAVS